MGHRAGLPRGRTGRLCIRLIFKGHGYEALAGALAGFAGVMAYAYGTAVVYPDLSVDGGNFGWYTVAFFAAMVGAGHATGFAAFWRWSQSLEA